jgi:hypothetical protein
LTIPQAKQTLDGSITSGDMGASVLTSFRFRGERKLQSDTNTVPQSFLLWYYLPYGASAIRDHRKNTANFTVASNLPNNFGEKILYRLSTVCLPSVYLSTHTQVDD